MYSSKFVVTVLVNGEIQKELHNGVVPIPFGSDYSLRFRNKHDRRAVVMIYIDGENVSGSGYVIPANDKIDIRRHADKDQAFKFVHLESAEAHDHGKNGPNHDKVKGVIEARFHLEKETPKPTHTVIDHHYHHHYPKPNPWYNPYPYPWYSSATISSTDLQKHCTTLGGSVNNTPASCSMSNLVGMGPSEATFGSTGPTGNIGAQGAQGPPGPTPEKATHLHNRERRSRGATSCSTGSLSSLSCGDAMVTNCSMPAPPVTTNLQEGCTVPGAYTGQSFSTIHIDIEDDFVSIKMVLQGYSPEVRKPSPPSRPVPTVVSENETKPTFCESCGSKVGVDANFCGSCGKKL